MLFMQIWYGYYYDACILIKWLYNIDADLALNSSINFADKTWKVKDSC